MAKPLPPRQRFPLATPCAPDPAPRSRRVRSVAEEINRLFTIRETATAMAALAEEEAHRLIEALDALMGDVDFEDDDCDLERSIGFDECELADEENPASGEPELGATEDLNQVDAWRITGVAVEEGGFGRCGWIVDNGEPLLGWTDGEAARGRYVVHGGE